MNGSANKLTAGWAFRATPNTTLGPVDFKYGTSVPNAPPSVTLTAPANGASFTAGANIPLSATATDSDGAISKVDFFTGSTLLGTATAGVGNVYSIPWNNVAAGHYALTAVAVDNQSASTTSVPVNLTVNPAPPPNFITGVTLGAVRTNFSGFLGMKITVGASPLTVTQLGRYKLSGNSGAHSLKLVVAGTGADLAGGATSVNLAGGIAGQFVYGNLAAPLTLAANTAYYVATQETSGGDAWASFDTTVTHTGVAGVDGSVNTLGGGWFPRATPNTTLGPVDFR